LDYKRESDAPHPPLALEGRSVIPLLLTILVVDDWPDAAESMGQLLGLYGHTIYLAYDGKEAMEKAKRCKPDVVLLDIALPKITGLDVARILSDQGDRKPLLIAISGYCSKEDKAKAYKAGFDHFLAKPVDPGDLRHILEEEENYLFISKREMVGVRCAGPNYGR
jgi:CheY-like chemotaxis protein